MIVPEVLLGGHDREALDADVPARTLGKLARRRIVVHRGNINQ